MPQLVLNTVIRAPAAVCFDLIRDVRIQPGISADSSNGLGRTFAFESRYFGIKQRLKVVVLEYDRPRRFVDAMVEGYFESFTHIHEFDEIDGCTMMKDTLVWASPFGLLGKIIDLVFLKRHLTQKVATRNQLLKLLAESSPG